MSSWTISLIHGPYSLVSCKTDYARSDGMIVFRYSGPSIAFCGIIVFSRRGRLYGKYRSSRIKRRECNLTSHQTIHALSGDEGKEDK